ncbi:hypothetical protein [Actinomadura opuntiae]|uniref:hypothetical protein n=1 Tax=Actinomadura sp. OS1-43 TaxID=604315 RepID=UPI004062D567
MCCTRAWADSAYRTKAIDPAATLGIGLEPVRRDPAIKGFVPLPRRWMVERTFGWLMLATGPTDANRSCHFIV